MPEPILIEFKTDLTQLDQAVDTLEQLGVVDKQTADGFRKTSQAAKEYNAELAKAGKTADAVTIDIQDMVKAIKEVPKKIVEDSAKKSLDDTGKAADTVTTKSQKLTTQLRQLKAELQQMEMAGKGNTAEYKRMAAQAGALEDQIGDTAQRVKILSSDTKNLDAALSLATGVAGGFAVAQGAAALFGSENEDVQKALLKVQAALAIVNGLQAVAATLNKDSAASVVILGTVQKAYTAYLGQSTAAMVVFKNVMLGLGIGAVIVGITALVMYMNSLQEEVSAVDVAMGEANKSIVEQRVQIDALVKVAQNQNANMEVRRQAIKKLNEISPEYLGNLTVETINTDAAAKAIRGYLDSLKAKALATALESKLVEEYNKKLDAQAMLTRALNGEVTNGEMLKALTKGQTVREMAVENIREAGAAISDLSQMLEKVMIKGGIDAAITVNPQTADKSIEAVKTYVKEVGAALEGITPEDLPEDYLFPVTQLQEATAKGIDSVKKYEDAVIESSAKSKEAALADIEEVARAREAAFDQAASIAMQVADLVTQFQQNAYNQDLQNLDKQLANKQISQDAYDKKLAEMKTKQAKQDKAKAVFEALINIPAAIIEALPNIPLSILAGVLGAAQLAAIIGQPVPQFFAEGTRNVTGGTPGKDSVPAYLMPGEGVMPTSINREYDGILTAIYNKSIPSGYLNAIANGESAGMPIMIGANMDYELLAELLGSEISALPIASLSIDEHGFQKALIAGNNKTMYLNNRYKS